VDGLLRGLTARQLTEWMAYESQEPFMDRRSDLQAASIACVIANVAAAQGRSRKRFTLEDFLLHYGKPRKKSAEAPAQSWRDQKLLGMMFAAAFNADADATKKRKR
jgi:hypothetical protein